MIVNRHLRANYINNYLTQITFLRKILETFVLKTVYFAIVSFTVYYPVTLLFNKTKKYFKKKSKKKYIENQKLIDLTR